MMDNFKYPDHALKNLSEVKELVQRAAKGELIKLYSVVRTGLPAFAIFSIKPVQEDVDEYEVAVDRVYPLTPPESDSKVQGDTGRLNLRWRNITADMDKNTAIRGFLFTNYWHAYAYAIKEGLPTPHAVA